jgi:hypothetical protein
MLDIFGNVVDSSLASGEFIIVIIADVILELKNKMRTSKLEVLILFL